MRIVVLDGYTLNPGDLSWDALRALGRCEIYDRSPREQVVERARQAEIVLTNKIPLPAEILGQLPACVYVGVLATGYNVVDVAAASRQGIVVTNIPAYGTHSVAQLTIAHLLNLATRVGDHARGVAHGRWSQSVDWCYWQGPLVELAGLSLGIIGFGRIGRAVSEIALALGMNVLTYSLEGPSAIGANVQFVDLDEIFTRCDVVSLHCPLTPETHHLVDARRLAQMKPTALLINTSRGPLVDEEALAEALNAGRIGGAGLDVLSREPPRPDNPLLTAKNCFITPHLAWATRAARQRLLQVAIDNIRSFLAGAAVNVVH